MQTAAASEKKQAILSRCFDVFSQEGYHGLSMRKLSGHLGVTTGALYHHYKNKEELFIDLVRFHTSADIDTAVDLICGIEDVSTRANILIEFIEQRSDYFRKMILLVTDFYRQEEFAAKDETSLVKEEIKSTLTSYQNAVAKILKLDHPKAGRAALGFIIGTLLQQFINAQAASLDDLAALTFSLKKEFS